jgi:hypothetical protein
MRGRESGCCSTSTWLKSSSWASKCSGLVGLILPQQNSSHIFRKFFSKYFL